MKRSIASESWFAYGSSASTLVNCPYGLLVVMLRGTKEGILLLAFFSLGDLNNVFCSLFVVLQSNCGFITWVGLVASSRGFFGFTELFAQVDYFFQIESLCMFWLPVFPPVALITEHCHVNL